METEKEIEKNTRDIATNTQDIKVKFDASTIEIVKAKGSVDALTKTGDGLNVLAKELVGAWQGVERINRQQLEERIKASDKMILEIQKSREVIGNSIEKASKILSKIGWVLASFIPLLLYIYFNFKKLSSIFGE